MPPSELRVSNYRRISYINWALSVPLLLIFAWPYFFFSDLISVSKAIAFPGSILFALPFLFTILHGHVTMALGAAHRHHYYSWLIDSPLTYGLLFHPLLIRTRFRLMLFFISLIILMIGFLLRRG